MGHIKKALLFGGILLSLGFNFAIFGEMTTSGVAEVTSFDMKKYSNLAAVFKRYTLPVERYCAGKYVRKGFSIGRIINAEKFKLFIKDNNLCSLKGPNNFLYNHPDMDLILLAEKIDFSFDRFLIQPVSFEEIKELLCVAENVNYLDWDMSNFGRDTRGKIAFIDMEDKSFGEWTAEESWYCPMVLYAVSGLKRTFDENPDSIQKDAYNYLCNRYEEIVQLYNHNFLQRLYFSIFRFGLIKHCLYKTCRYDHLLGVNYEKARKDWDAFLFKEVFKGREEYIHTLKLSFLQDMI